MAQDIGAAVGTVGKAAAVLAQLAGSSRIAVDSFDEIAIAAIKWEEATGKAAAETVKDFEKIAKDPVKAVRELNDSMNFLTAATYSQIVALQKQGDTQAAATLAEQAYSEALTSRANKIVENLGYVETAWKSVKEFAKDAWDAFLDVGRAETPEERLTRLQNKLEEIRSGGRGGRAQFGLGIGAGGDQAAAEKAVTDELVAQEEARKRVLAASKQVALERAAFAKIDE
jgi:phage-related minor tail protein